MRPYPFDREKARGFSNFMNVCSFPLPQPFLKSDLCLND